MTAGLATYCAQLPRQKSTESIWNRHFILTSYTIFLFITTPKSVNHDFFKVLYLLEIIFPPPYLSWFLCY